MHPYKTLLVTAIDTGGDPYIVMTLRAGEDRDNACTARKVFDMERWDEVRDIIGWASHAFLSAADELTEDGWEISHVTDCTVPHLEDTDA